MFSEAGELPCPHHHTQLCLCVDMGDMGTVDNGQGYPFLLSIFFMTDHSRVIFGTQKRQSLFHPGPSESLWPVVGLGGVGGAYHSLPTLLRRRVTTKVVVKIKF